MKDEIDIRLEEIPRNDLIRMLCDSAWRAGGREDFGRSHGYSLDVCEETAIRDVVYRKEPLYETPEEAIYAHWKRHY